MRVSLISALVTAFLGGMAAVARPAMAQEFPLLRLHRRSTLRSVTSYRRTPPAFTMRAAPPPVCRQ